MNAAAAAATAAILPEILPAAGPASPLEGVSGLFGRFVQYLDVAPKTAETYARAIRQFAGWLDGSGIRRPSRDDVRAYRDHLRDSGRKAGTVRAYLAAVKAFFAWTEDEGLYPNVAEKVKAGKVDASPKKDALTAGEVRAVLKAAEGRGEADLRDYAILLVLFTAGLRAVEVRRLDVADLAAECGVAVLRVQGKGHAEKDASVRLQPAAEAAIRLYLAERGPVAQDAPLFASTSNNSRGGRLSTVSISCMVKAAFRRAGIDSPRKTCHSTRHTAVTLALLAGMSLQETADFARHASIATTTIYAHNIDRLRNGCGAAIASQIL